MIWKSTAALFFVIYVAVASNNGGDQQKSDSPNYLNLLHPSESNSADSSAVFNAISQLSEKRQSMIKRNLFKRIQVPFKWGKRSSPDDDLETVNQELDQCADLFVILIGPNRNELTRFDRSEVKSFFDACFEVLIDSLFETGSFEENVNAQMINKRYNTPFKWG